MKKLTVEAAERLASKFRTEAQFSQVEPLNCHSVLQSKHILTVFRPMSVNAGGLSIVSPDRQQRYMLINSCRPIGRQRFTIAHELYHLFYDDNPEPHMCFDTNGGKNPREANADLFASALLMPRDGIIAYIPDSELHQNHVSLGTVMRLEQLFGVSHQAMCYRLKRLKLITEDYLQQLLSISPARTAWEFGYSTKLYDDGDGRKAVIGDFIAKAKVLFDEDRISEGHYMELKNLVNDGESEDCP